MDAIIACYFTNEPDAQRGITWQADESLVAPLANSVNERGYKLILLNDCFDEGERNGIVFVTVHPNYQPYFGRWEAEHDYLLAHPEIKRAYLLDSTDVVMQHDPFYEMDRWSIYTGDEFEVLGNKWIIEDNDFHPLRAFIRLNADMLLLNCGVVGGSRKDLMKLCSKMIYVYEDSGKVPKFDMGIYNYVMRTEFNHRLIRGRQVTTIFKQYEKDAGGWFKHK